MRLNQIQVIPRSFGILAIIVSSCLSLALPASADVHSGDKGKTTCYVFKNNKLVTKNSCSYKATIGGSTTYGISDYDFTIKGFGDISTYSHSNAIINSQGEPIINANGSVKSQISMTVNKKPAIARYRQLTSYNLLPYGAEDVYQKQNSKNVLSCMATKNNSLEVCIPLSKANLEQG